MTTEQVVATILGALVARWEGSMTARYGLPGPEFVPITETEIEALRQAIVLLNAVTGTETWKPKQSGL